MKRLKVVLAFGTRPEIIKMAPLVWEFSKDPTVDLVLLDTGQHFDWNMSGSFVSQLGLRPPDFHLNVGTGGQAKQTGRIMQRSEPVIEAAKPDIVLVEGDTNSALGVALTASKLGFKVGHVEAGCRSFDKTMPEELNRMLIADAATIHFPPTERCRANLIREGINPRDIFLVGHPIVDLLYRRDFKSNDSAVLRRLHLKRKSFYLLTLHRRENVDNAEKLQSLLVAISKVSERFPVVFPIHPHTRQSVKRFGLTPYLKNFDCIGPVPYPDSLALIRNSRVVLTDSGGVQQEAALLRTPCITLRETTEWMETVDAGVNFLKLSRQSLPRLMQSVESNMQEIQGRFRDASGIFGKQPVARKMLTVLKKRLQ
jgi:UDP-N-acetylglucosamine 2-epimerase (non-hydrolysing)